MKLIFRDTFDVENAAIIQLDQKQGLAVALIGRLDAIFRNDFILVVVITLTGIQADLNRDFGLDVAGWRTFLGNRILE